MWYYFYMNKDVIYIEPEDDITDIITKIEGSKEKIVALVPPKKAGVFRSVVNIKLISKVGKTADKTIVLVTVDPSIVKLAAATRMPVTKNLQTAPAIPEADAEMTEMAKEEIVSDPTEAIEEEIVHAEEATTKADSEDKDEDDEEEEDLPAKKKDKKADKKSKSAGDKSGNPIINWIKSHKKLTIFGCIGLVVLIVVLIWAFVIAPAVDITVGISTETNNFAETVTFTTNMAEENAAEGKFYLEEKKIESVAEVPFEATGQKNNGEKASGEVTVVARIGYEGGTKIVNTGDKFTIRSLTFVADNGVTMSYSGDESVCSNIDENTPIGKVRAEGCVIYAKVKVTASEPGAKYNISPAESGWSTTANVSVYSDKAMSGGTDDIITVVEQGDIEKAKDALKSSNEEENKVKLMDSIGDGVLALENSFEQDTSAAVATPAAGEEVKDGTKPTLKATTTAKVYVVDKSKLEEFIREKAKLEDDQKIYEIKDPYVENFVKGDTGYAGKLKTTYAVGPKVTDNDILEMVKGKGIGDARHDLSSINGVTSVGINTSYPWVSAIPSDTNKITINMEVKNSDNNDNQQQ